MDIKLVVILIVASIPILFIILTIWFYKKDWLIRNKSTENVLGTIVSYSYNGTKAPVVEYFVNGKKYKNILRYSYVSRVSTPFNSIDTSAKDNVLHTKLRLKENSMLSINTIMEENFPLGSQMEVYYNPRKPKLSYIQRYAPSYLWILFLIVAILTILSTILLFLTL